MTGMDQVRLLKGIFFWFHCIIVCTLLHALLYPHASLPTLIPILTQRHVLDPHTHTAAPQTPVAVLAQGRTR